MTWTLFTKRTDDPKLRYIERRLDAMGIPHRRNGYSFHGPILEVPEEHEDRAWALLDERVNVGGGQTVRLDDIEDDDPRFL